MNTRELTLTSRGQDDLQNEALTMAVAIVLDRVERLPSEDRDELFELVRALPSAESPEECESIVGAMREILEQRPIRPRRMMGEGEPAGQGLQSWMDHVSKRIRTLRDQAGMTQDELAERSGLPQSHISRLENGKHSPSNATLQKIAKALSRDISELDPSASSSPGP